MSMKSCFEFMSMATMALVGGVVEWSSLTAITAFLCLSNYIKINNYN